MIFPTAVSKSWLLMSLPHTCQNCIVLLCGFILGSSTLIRKGSNVASPTTIASPTSNKLYFQDYQAKDV